MKHDTMKHHFGDNLSREQDYWSISTNRQRWAFRYNDLETAPADTEIITVTKHDLNWERVYDLAALKELTLHEPSKEQVQAIENLTDCAPYASPMPVPKH